MLTKAAGDAVPTYSLSGRLQLSASGWLLLAVPNALVLGFFKALHEPGISLPLKDGRLDAHISVMRKSEVDQIGADRITERGQHFTFQTGPIKVVEPKTWEGVSKVWYLTVTSPELRKLRASYGLTPQPNTDWDFHITLAIRKTGVLQANDVTKAASTELTAADLEFGVREDWRSGLVTRLWEPGWAEKVAKGKAMIRDLQALVDAYPAADPGYGYVWYSPATGAVHGVVGDGDERDIARKFQDDLVNLAGKDNTRVESEYTPAEIREEGSGWVCIRRGHEPKKAADKTVTPVIKTVKSREDEVFTCPHCQEQIGEKGWYVDHDGYEYHRGCVDKGPIGRCGEQSQKILKSLYGSGEWYGSGEKRAASPFREKLKHLQARRTEDDGNQAELSAGVQPDNDHGRGSATAHDGDRAGDSKEHRQHDGLSRQDGSGYVPGGDPTHEPPADALDGGEARGQGPNRGHAGAVDNGDSGAGSTSAGNRGADTDAQEPVSVAGSPAADGAGATVRLTDVQAAVSRLADEGLLDVYYNPAESKARVNVGDWGDGRPLAAALKQLGLDVELADEAGWLDEPGWNLVWPEKKAAGLAEDLSAAEADCEEPKSEEQARAGNYRHGHVRLHGLNVTLETAKGMTRRGKDKDGTPWEIKMQHSYGYVKRTKSEADEDHFDVFIGEHPESEVVFVVDQYVNGEFDEHKGILGCLSREEARETYLANYCDGWKGCGTITSLTLPQFKEWIRTGDTSKPLAGQKLKFEQDHRPHAIGYYTRESLRAMARRKAAALIR